MKITIKKEEISDHGAVLYLYVFVVSAALLPQKLPTWAHTIIIVTFLFYLVAFLIAASFFGLVLWAHLRT